MVDTSFRESERGDPLLTDGGVDDADEGRDRYGMYTYNFAWYFPRVEGYRSILKASALVYGSFLIIPALVVLGYSYRVGRAAATGVESPPPLEDWKALMRDGARFAVLAVPVAFLFIIPIVGAYVGLPFIAAYMGSGSLKAALTDRTALALMGSTWYLTSFLEYGVYFTAMVILTVLLIGVGWVLGPGFIVVSGGAFMGYVYNRAADRDIVAPPSERAA